MKYELGNLMAEDPQQETINLLTYRLNAVTIERDEWKAKFIKQNKDLGCEMMDPNGTIWDYAKKLQTELAAVTEQRDGLRSGIDCASDQLTAVTEQRDRMAEALQKLADCDWVITLPDRMDAVRSIAREALAAVKGGDHES